MDDRVNYPIIDTLLVPKGAEYGAIYRGLKQIQGNKPQVIAIPIGSQGLMTFLEQWRQSPSFLKQPPKGILLIGLGGSLSPLYQVGRIVVYQTCGQVTQKDDFICRKCDSNLTNFLYKTLKIAKINGLTSNALIWNAQEKQRLGQEYNVEVVDMESFTVLETLQPTGIPISVIRVISDNVTQTLPDLTTAISAEGLLKPLPLAWTMLKNPLASIHLIRGSLQGLKTLQQLAYQLFTVLQAQD